MRNRKIKIGTGFVLMLSLFYFFDNSGVFAALVCSAAVHELGHLVGIIVTGSKVTRFSLELTGAAITYDNRHVTYFEEAFIAAMGPVFGLLFSVITASFARYNEDFYIISGISFCLSFLNLLPAQNLDGGKLLYSVISRLKDEAVADKIICVTSCMVSFGMLVLGIYMLIITKSNFTILLAGVWILFDFIRVNLRRGI